MTNTRTAAIALGFLAALLLAGPGPASAQRLGQPLAGRGGHAGHGFPAARGMRSGFHGFGAGPFRIGVGTGRGRLDRRRFAPGRGFAPLARRGAGAPLLFVPVPVAVPVAVPAYGYAAAYDAALPASAVASPAGYAEPGCALLDVDLVGQAPYRAEVALPALGAETPEALQAVLRERMRRGRPVRLEALGGVGILVPAGPGVRGVAVWPCR